jgi:hypothetical protein
MPKARDHQLLDDGSSRFARMMLPGNAVRPLPFGAPVSGS